MAYEKIINKTDYENDWAKDIKDDPIHITKAVSGAQGYYCLGCGEEMQAYKSDIRKSFFRHDAKNINKDKVECVIASKVYRERLAETILNRLKFVKVPALYKYPPKGIDGIPMLLQKSKIITASYTKAQEWFYEDKDGNIENGKNPEVDDRYLLIRPDVTFFNEKGEAILFIEFVITHKLDEEKITKLSRLGIDTLQIIIPKVPEEEIEKALKSSRKFKWVYNELEANTTYVSVSEGNTEEISSIDEVQRKLFEESFRCRTAKVNQLIRDIDKCLRSESYRRTERLFESELSRVEKNRERAQQKLGELERQCREEARGRNQRFEDRIRKNQDEFQQKFRTEEKELVSNIESAEQRLGDLEESNRKNALERNRGEGEKIESKQTELEERYFKKDRQLKHGVQDYLSAQAVGIPIERTIEGEEELINIHRDEKKRIINKIAREELEFEETVRAEIESDIIRTEESIQNIRSQQERIEGTIWNEFRNKIEFEDSEIERLTSEERELEKTVRDEFLRELSESPSKFPREIKAILDAKRVGSNFTIAIREEELYERAKKFFEKET